MADDGFCPPNGRQNKPNKNINGNCMYAVSVSAHGITSCSAAAYRRFAPINGCLYKKHLDMFSPFASISAKTDLNAVEKGYFSLQYVIFCQKMKIDGFVCLIVTDHKNKTD
jgi:hypothetical protein